MQNSATGPTGPSTKEPVHLNTILILFIILRLTILLFFTPQGLLNAFTDTHYYYNTALLSQQGYLPFVNMWYEYPPILAYLVQGVFALIRQVVPVGDLASPSYLLFAIMLRLVVMVFDAGSLVLLYRIARQLWGTETANWTGWVYTALSLPMFYAVFAHHPIVVFWLLLAIDAWLRGSRGGSALAAGMGIATKLLPLFLLGAVLRALWGQWRRLLQYGLLAALPALLSYLPFIWSGSGAWVAASFRALLGVKSYATIWALLDGNWGPGNYGALTTRLSLDLAGQTPGSPAVLPGWLLMLVFGCLYAWGFFRFSIRSQQDFVRFVAFSALLFHLWLKGWSPQYATLLIPLLLLCFPGQRGLKFVLLLTGLCVLEWPVAAVFTARGFYAAVVISRTLLLAWICYQLARDLARHRQLDGAPGFVEGHT